MRCKVVNVLYASERDFYADFDDLISVIYPEMDIHIVPFNNLNEYGKDRLDVLENVINAGQVDVLALSWEQYTTLVNNNKLYKLDPLIKKDQFTVKNIVPSIIHALRKIG